MTVDLEPAPKTKRAAGVREAENRRLRAPRPLGLHTIYNNTMGMPINNAMGIMIAYFG